MGTRAKSGQDSTALGTNANADAIFSTAIGSDARVRGQQGVAVGAGAQAAGGATAVGTLAQSNGTQSAAFGGAAKANGANATALGFGANASGEAATAVGTGASAESASSSAVGRSALARGDGATALGVTASALNKSALAAGHESKASGLGAIAVGGEALASGEIALAVGSLAKATAAGSVAMGFQANATAVDTVAQGTKAAATKGGAVAIGSGANASAQQSVAMGAGADALKDFATAIGSFAEASGEQSLALGSTSVAKSDFSTAVGSSANALGVRSTALGNLATASGASAIAIGPNAQATGAQSVSIGDGSTVSVAGGVALGSSAAATTGAGVAGFVPANVGAEQRAAIEATQSTTGAIAVGDAAARVFRQITGVAAGTADSDAVNVSQLRAVSQSGALGKGAQTSDQGSVAIGQDAKTGAVAKDAVALGHNAQADGSNTVALGAGAKANDANSVALGSGATTAPVVGTASGMVNGTKYDFAGGQPVGTVSVGAPGAERTITNVAAGRLGPNSTDAVNGSQLNATNTELGKVAEVANRGWNLSANGEATPQNIAPGGTVDFVAGNNTNVTRTGNQVRVNVSPTPTFDSVSVGGAAGSPGATLGANGLTTRGADGKAGPSVTTGGIDAGAKAITNVADGKNAGEAVNFGQLQAVAGKNTVAAGTGSVALGDNAKTGADATNAVALGNNAQADGVNGVALGSKAQVDGVNGVALGSKAQVDGVNGVAIGSSAQADGTNGVALGSGAKANDANSVALGSGATTAPVVGTASGTVNGTKYDFAGGQPVGTVSVGAPGAERTITNVAAGRLGPNSTDAVNGSQLHATNTELGQVAEIANLGWNLSANGEATPQNIAPGGTVDFIAGNNTSVTRAGNRIRVDLLANPVFDEVVVGGATGGARATLGANGLTTRGADGAAGPSVTTAGIDAGGKVLANVANGKNASDAVNLSQLQAAVGKNTVAAGQGSVAVGEGSKTGTGAKDAVAVGPNAQVDGANGVAVGSKAQTQGEGGVAVGDGAKVGADAKDAVAVGQDAKADGAGSVALGNNAQTIGQGGVAIGQDAKIGAAATDAVALGRNAQADGANGVALGSGAKANDANSVALGSGATTAPVVGTASGMVNGTKYDFAGGQPVGTVSVGAPGAERTITNVAAGRLGPNSTDAVNGSQLHATNTELGQVAEIANLGWNLSANGEATPQNIAPGGTVDFIAGNNTSVTRAGNRIRVDLLANPVFDEVVVGGATGGARATLGANGLTTRGADGAAGPSVTTAGIDAGGKVLANVANGKNASDAVNLSQLQAAVGKNTVAAGQGSVAVGEGSKTGTGAKDAVAVGPNAQVDGANGVAVGSKAQTQGEGGVAVGDGAKVGADAKDAVAVGQDAKADGAGSVALGNNAQTIGQGGVAIGQDAKIGAAATDAVALGRNAQADGANGVALGSGAKANDANSVALGSGATTAPVVGTASGMVNGTKYDFAGGQPVGTVSVGAPGAERTITNVAAGRLGPNSTDAVNGSQLNATNDALGAIGKQLGSVGAVAQNSVQYDAADKSRITLGGVASTDGGVTNGTRIGNVAQGEISSTSTDAVNGAQLAAANSRVSGFLGGGADVTAGRAPTYTVQGVASDNVGGAISAIDGNLSAINGAISGGGTKYAQSNSTAAGAAARGQESVAFGPKAVADGASAVAVGDGASAQGAQGVAIGFNAVARESGGVALGAGSVASTPAGIAGHVPASASAEERAAIRATTGTQAAVSVGDAANGQFRQITGVAAGTADSDAANVAQLRASTNAVAASSAQYERNPDGSTNYGQMTLGNGQAPEGTRISNVAPGVQGNDAANMNQLAGATATSMRYTDAQIGAVKSRIAQVERNAYAGVASAMAVQMPGSSVPGKTVMRMGAANFKGESAVGISFRRTAMDNGWSLTGGVGVSRAGAAATVGAEWVFN